METAPIAPSASMPDPVSAPAPTPVAPPLMTFGQLFGRAFRIWKAQWWKIALTGAIPALVIAPVGLAFSFLNDRLSTGTLVAVIGALTIAFVVIAARLMPMQIQLAAGADARMGLGEAWAASKGMTLSLVGLGILTFMVVAGGSLLIVPGIIWSLSFTFVPFVRVLDGIRGRDALVRSRQLVKGHWGWTFARLFIFALVTILIGLPLIVIGAVFNKSAMAIQAVNVATNLLNILVVAPLSLGFLVAMHGTLTATKAGSLQPMPRAKGIYTLAAVFGLLMPVMMVGILWGMLSAVLHLRPSQTTTLQQDLPSLSADEIESGLQAQEEPPAKRAPDPASDDLDDDGRLDAQEMADGDSAIGNPDTDGDGLSDGDEYYLLTYADIADTDGDGYGDGAELASGYDPTGPDRPLSEETRAMLVDLHAQGQLHEPTISTLRPILQ